MGKPAAEVYVLQVARLGGSKLGLPDDPESAWIDHDVFFDRERAEEQAKLHETLPLQDATGRDMTGEVATVARVVTAEQLGDEFGQARVGQLLTMFRKQLIELMDEERRSTT